MASRSVRELDEAPEPQGAAAPLTGVPAADAVRHGSGADFARRNGALLGVFGAYLLAAVLLPTAAAVAVSDDWVYTRSVETLLREGRLELLDATAATAVFQIFWGTAFAAVLPNVFGALRVATVVFIGLSGLAVYGLALELRLDRSVAALAAAAYLFNPLLFSLSYTFMTDPYSVGLLVISTYYYSRLLRGGRIGRLATRVGAAVAALAVLQRAHGVLIPMAVVAFLVLTRRMRADAAGARLLLQVTGIPVAVTVLFFLYLQFIHGITSYQQGFVASVLQAGVRDTALLVARLSFIEATYLGLFALPVLVVAIPALRRVHTRLSAPAWILVAGWWTILVAGLSFFASDGRKMPYVPHFMGRPGLGPNDLAIARTELAGSQIFGLLTFICAGASVVVLLLLCRAFLDKQDSRPIPPTPLLLLVVTVWQMAGVVLPSFVFRNWTVGTASAPSLDRYLIPLMPFALLLVLWAAGRVAVGERYVRLAAVSVAVVAVFSVAGTRDSLVFHQAIWDMAAKANARGVPNERLDAGFSWDAYHLWQPSGGQPPPTLTPNPPWWVAYFAPATDSTYVVAAGIPPGFDVVERQPYSSWLQNDPTEMFLVRRQPPPPAAAEGS